MKTVIITDGNRVYQAIGYELVQTYVGGEATINVFDVLGKAYKYAIHDDNLEEFELCFQNNLYVQHKLDISELVLYEY